MKRREFLTVFAGTALAWPLDASAQQSSRMQLIGVLMGFAENDPIAQSMVAAFKGALPKLGWREGGNVHIELRWAGPDPEKANLLAKELAALRPDVILGQTTPVVRALAREVTTSPIVFVTVTDPIGSGFAASLAHPGGNITGFTVDDSALGGKWVELLKQLAPSTSHMALLFNPAGPPLQFFMPSIDNASSSAGVHVSVATVRSKNDIEGAIAEQAREPGGGIIVLPNAFNTTNRELIIALAARYRVPAIYFSAFGAQSGGLIGYGSDYAEQARQAASYVDRILKGTSPADLPVQAPTKFELVINLRTARALGLIPPEKLIAIADEVIE